MNYYTIKPLEWSTDDDAPTFDYAFAGDLVYWAFDTSAAIYRNGKEFRREYAKSRQHARALAEQWHQEETAKGLAAVEIAEWQKATPETMFYDGDQLLVAVPVVGRHDPKKTYYEYAVIVAHCDAEMPVSFDLSNGDDWGWDWDDVEWFMPLSEFRLPRLPLPSPPKETT